MPGIRMVPLLTVPSAFQARVVAARLGSDGILAQVRGGVDGPYPVGAVDVLVAEDDLDLAWRLLNAEDTESDVDLADGTAPGRPTVLTGLTLTVVAALALLAVATVSVLSRFF